MGSLARQAEQDRLAYAAQVATEDEAKKLNLNPTVTANIIENCTITYYCAEEYPHICGFGLGITATGAECNPGHIVAVDPNVIPLHSKVIVDYGDGDLALLLCGRCWRICSYSGGADSDIMIDVIERARAGLGLPPVKYVFFNTGLEMQATKDHVKATAAKYGVEIEECRPKISIVTASRTYGIPFISKIMSAGLSEWQKKGVPLSIAGEYEQAEDKTAKRQELRERYPKCESVINFLCCCNSAGEPRPNIQLVINSSKFMRDFIGECPPDFTISAKCCDCCKKQVAHQVQKAYDMVITGERRAEGGMRSVPRKDNTSLCFTETNSGQYRLRPLYYVTDADKAWYKDYYGIRYSDAYEVYGLTRTGCCGCPISYKAQDDLELIRPYEPNVVKAAWNIFGKSYLYREKYNEYKRDRLAAEQQEKQRICRLNNILMNGGLQISMFKAANAEKEARHDA